MKVAQLGTDSVILAPVTAATTARTSSNLDCAGSTYATIRVILGAEANTNSTNVPISIKESDEKYKLYDVVHSERQIQETDLQSFLEARDGHFSFVRRNSFIISALVVVVQTILLSVGCYLIKINQLSVGQLVSAEIIISGIFIPLSKLPLTLEAVYDYETSKYKIT